MRTEPMKTLRTLDLSFDSCVRCKQKLPAWSSFLILSRRRSKRQTNVLHPSILPPSIRLNRFKCISASNEFVAPIHRLDSLGVKATHSRCPVRAPPSNNNLVCVEHGGEVVAVRVHPHHDAGPAVHEKSGRDGEQGGAGGRKAVLGAPTEVHGGPGSEPQVPREFRLVRLQSGLCVGEWPLLLGVDGMGSSSWRCCCWCQPR